MSLPPIRSQRQKFANLNVKNKKLIIGSAISGKWDPRSVAFGRIRVARPGTHVIGGT